ncbi:hypothetical protein BU23DRAFT_537170 [Bimuria novae-zelandiae CBS 107.79]|uniref:C3H1-type domain-containing protein n=1 Tax=Bimuria novae-zelandiae CBS 107.79 TaxID=1447943 RepID=A0A6A5V0N7_9PLEO|nr:hypothetical protein BU23DRAFT_537170 [Bimuria novae-zelandiae CBS 107.79]
MAPASFFSNGNSPMVPIGTPVRAPAQASSARAYGESTASDPASMWARIDKIFRNDQEKNQVIEELMTRYEYVTQEYQRLLSSPSDQLQVQQLKQQLAGVQAALERNPFVMILIDGDGMIFANEFLLKGLVGGKEAAATLYRQVVTYIERETETIPTTSRVLCRVYANVKGLAETLVRAGLIEEVSHFEEFVRGFTNGRTLFDFIDVGPGKDRADDKIIETLKLFIDDFHCRQIFFGCSHDNGFARPLEEYMGDVTKISKVTLLEGVPFEKELLGLPYKTKKFDGLFREAKINVLGVPASVSPAPVKNYNVFNGLPTRLPPAPAALDSPTPSVRSLIDLPRTPSTTTLDGLALVSKTKNWAALAAAPPPPQPVTEYRPANREEIIARNRIGQRVDPPCRDYDKNEVDRIKKIKMCNVHFLRNECPFGNACTHLHEYNPTEAEIATLRLVARMAPCQNGSGCQEIKCIYGHRCPAPPSKTNKTKGTKNCIFGDACKFPESLHDIDCNVVKTLVIR